MSARMAAYWLENARPLGAFFKDMKLREIRPALVAAYQNARTDAGRAPKTINGELSVLRQILKHAKLWYRFALSTCASTMADRPRSRRSPRRAFLTG